MFREKGSRVSEKKPDAVMQTCYLSTWGQRWNLCKSKVSTRSAPGTSKDKSEGLEGWLSTLVFCLHECLCKSVDLLELTDTFELPCGS